MTGTLYKKVGIAAAIMMASVMLSRVIGIFRDVIIAYVSGAGGEVDAYQMAFILPEILNHILATGFLSIVFIPIFSKYIVKNDEEEGWRVFSLILSSFGSLLLVFIVICVLRADLLVEWCAPGISDPAIKALTIRMTRIVLPAQFFFFAGGLFMAVQFAKEKFFLPALAPLIYNIGIILGGLLLGRWIGVEGFSWGVLAGAFVGNFALQWWGAGRIGMKFRFSFNIFHPEFKGYILLALPLMIGFSMTFSTEFFFRFFGSYMSEGTVAALNYGLRLMFVLVGIFGQAIGTAIYPFISKLAAEGRMEEMNSLLNKTLRYLSMVIPFSALLIVLRHEIVFILFHRGRFGAAATDMTSYLLTFLLIGAFAFAAQTVVVRGYYAVKDMLSPAIFGTAAVAVSIPFYIMGMKWFGSAGIALGVSFSSILQVAVLYFLWNRRTNSQEGKGVYLFFGRIILLSVVIGIVLEIVRRTALSGIDHWSKDGAFIICIVSAVLFIALLFSAGRILGIREIEDIPRMLVERIRKRRGTMSEGRGTRDERAEDQKVGG